MADFTHCVKCEAPKSTGSECPSCGVIYAKAEAAASKNNREDDDLHENEVVPEPKQEKNTEETNDRLTTCPACESQISKNANACPHCGEPLEKTKKTAEKGKTSDGFKGCLIIIIAVIAIGYFFGSQDDSKTGTKSDADFYAEFIAEEFVKKHLKAPRTAKFVNSNARELKPGVWQAFGQVDAHNGFGALIRSDWYVELTVSSTCKEYSDYTCWKLQEGPIISSR